MKQQGAGSVSNTSATLQDVASVDDFLNVAATETVPLFEHLEFEFLLEHEYTSHGPARTIESSPRRRCWTRSSV